jgi:RNA polymerase sigma factor (sigma-70 family)
MDLIYGVCLKYLDDSEDAKDAVINIYEELILKVRKHQIEFFKAWLYQLAKNHCLMQLRKKKQHFEKIGDHDMQYAASSHLEEVKNKEIQLNLMQSCIDELGQEQQLSVRMFYLQNKCYKQIADETDSEIGKVKSYIQNGRRNLKICMESKMKMGVHE